MDVKQCKKIADAVDETCVCLAEISRNLDDLVTPASSGRRRALMFGIQACVAGANDLLGRAVVLIARLSEISPDDELP